MKPDTVRKRIAALREMTAARGCTEAEALTAAAKAAELMREYGISESDLTIDQQSVRRKSAGHSARDDLWRKIAACTNTATIIHHEDDKPVRSFIGRDPGPEIAAYLYQVLDRAIDRAIFDFKAGSYYRRRRTLATKRRAVAEFTYFMVLRLCVRLSELFADTISAEARNAADVALTERFPHTTVITTRRRDTGKVTPAALDGLAAGDGVNLAHGVSGREETRLRIGGAS